MEFFHGPRSQVTNTDLAAALGTLGIPRNAEQPLQVLVGEIEQVAFYFEQVSECGTYPTAEMIQAWNTPDFSRTHPRHAMTYMRCALRSRHQLLAYAKGSTRIGLATRTGGQFEVVALPGGSPVPPVKTIPDAAANDRLRTEDLDLACCLLACGIPLWADIPFERVAADRITLFFQPSSVCGKFHTRPLTLAWQDRTWHERHPEHPFSYLSCAMENRRRLLREIRHRAPMIVFQRAGMPQFLSLNADSKTESLFMQELKKL